MNDSRVRRQIFDALNSALAVPGDPATEPPPVSAPPLAPNERVTRLTELMTAIRTEVHLTQSDAWLQVLEQVLTDKQVRSLTYGPESILAPAIETAWKAAKDSSLPALVPYDQAIEDFKERLFQIDAGITTTLGAVADVGAIIIWPDAKEPRLLSLVPPIHIAVLEASAIDDNLIEAMARLKWPQGMPTNALLISGPSKTADIEFKLVFGVHGPKEMVVIIITDQEASASRRLYSRSKSRMERAGQEKIDADFEITTTA